MGSSFEGTAPRGKFRLVENGFTHFVVCGFIPVICTVVTFTWVVRGCPLEVKTSRAAMFH